MTAVIDRPPRPLIGVFRSLRREHPFEALHVEGQLPEGLSGVLYRCGPGLHESADGIRYDHPFDGDGAVTAIRLGGGRASGAIRLVASEGLRDERRIGRRRYGGYGTPSTRPIADFLSFAKKNVANTSVMSWNGRLMALWEAGLPTELDPDTLDTLGTTDLDGVVPAVLSAHPHGVPQRQATYSFGVRYGARCHLDVFELPDRGRARRIRSIPVPATLVHDAIPTERHLVFFLAPMRMSAWSLLLGTSPADAFRWEPRLGTQVVVVPLDPAEPVRQLETDPFFAWHFSNAWERGDDIVLDFPRHPDFDSTHLLWRDLFRGTPSKGAGDYVRAVISRGGVALERLADGPRDFPMAAPRARAREHHRVWMLRDGPGGTPLDRLVCLDPDTGGEGAWEPGAGHLLSEPTLVQRPDARRDDDAWVLTLGYDPSSDRSYLAVLDAGHVADGPIARVWFDQHVPVTFHGCWLPDQRGMPNASSQR